MPVRREPAFPYARPAFVPRNANGMYAVGDTIAWSASLPEHATAAPGGYTYKIRKNNQEVPVLVNEPAGADANGDLHGRKTGYPNWDFENPRVMETARYFDVVNFAPRITAPAIVTVGFIDTITPPAGILVAFNQIPGPKELIPMIESDHNNRTPEEQGAWEARWREVLDTLVKGGTLVPVPSATP